MGEVAGLQDFLALGKRRYDRVTVEGLEFRVRSLTELENSELIQLWQCDEDGKPDPEKRHLLRARMIQVCLVDGEDQPLFEVEGAFPLSGLDQIMAMNSQITQKIGDFLFDFLGLTGKAAKAQEELAKN